MGGMRVGSLPPSVGRSVGASLALPSGPGRALYQRRVAFISNRQSPRHR